MANAPSIRGLQTVAERAELERDQAMAALFRVTEAVRRLHAQTEQLLAYRTEYQQRWTTQFRQLAAIEVVTSYQQFVVRLEQALEQLRQQTVQAEQDEVCARALLISHETHVASVRKLIERRVAEHARNVDRVEQRQTDETAAVMTRRAPRALMNNP